MTELFMNGAVPVRGVKDASTVSLAQDGRSFGRSDRRTFEQSLRHVRALNAKAAIGNGVLHSSEPVGFDGNGPSGRATIAGMPARVRLMEGECAHPRSATISVGAKTVWLLHLSGPVDVT